MSGTNPANTYDQAADHWQDRVQKHGYPQAYETLIKSTLQGFRAPQICDLGSGSGQMAAAYHAVFPEQHHMTLVDSSKRMLALAKRRFARSNLTLNLKHQTLETLPDQPLFDLILSAHMIEHCADPVAALGKIRRLLRPDGQVLLVISKPHICQIFIWLKWRHRWFSRETFLKMAKTAGLGSGQCLPLNGGIPARTSYGYLFQPTDNIKETL